MTARSSGRSLQRGLLGATGVVVAVILLAACGVREDEQPRVLGNDAVPTELSEEAPASTVPGEASTPQRIYIIETRNGTEEDLVPYLIPVKRTNEDDDHHRRVIEELVTFRPPDNETYTTAIPPTTGVLDVRMVTGPDGKNDVLEINLNQLEVPGPRLKLAIAQMVFTATAFSDVNGVRFLLNGSPIAVPLDVGESQTGAIVTEADFPQTNPTPTTSTSTTTAPPPEPLSATGEEPTDGS